MDLLGILDVMDKGIIILAYMCCIYAYSRYTYRFM